MKNRKKKKKIIIIVLISFICIFLLFYSLTSNRKQTFIEEFLKDAAVTIQKIVMFPFTALTPDKGEDASESYQIQKNLNV